MNITDTMKYSVSSAIFRAEAEGILQDIENGLITGENDIVFSERLAVYLSGRAFIMGRMAKGDSKSQALAAFAETVSQIESMSEEELNAAVAAL